MSERQEVRPGLYRHYKGGLYRVLGVAIHSETGEELAIYESEAGLLWARPVGMFCSTAEVGGKQVPRFEWVKNQSP